MELQPAPDSSYDADTSRQSPLSGPALVEPSAWTAAPPRRRRSVRLSRSQGSSSSVAEPATGRPVSRVRVPPVASSSTIFAPSDDEQFSDPDAARIINPADLPLSSDDLPIAPVRALVDYESSFESSVPVVDPSDDNDANNEPLRDIFDDDSDQEESSSVEASLSLGEVTAVPVTPTTIRVSSDSKRRRSSRGVFPVAA